MTLIMNTLVWNFSIAQMLLPLLFIMLTTVSGTEIINNIYRKKLDVSKCNTSIIDGVVTYTRKCDILNV